MGLKCRLVFSSMWLVPGAKEQFGSKGQVSCFVLVCPGVFGMRYLNLNHHHVLRSSIAATRLDCSDQSCCLRYANSTSIIIICIIISSPVFPSPPEVEGTPAQGRKDAAGGAVPTGWALSNG